MQATDEANRLWSNAEHQIADVLNNLDKVASFMEAAEKNHPNRFDFLKMTGKISKEQAIKELGSSSPFGGPLGAKPSGFGGQPSSTTISGFGPASTLPFGSATPKVSDGSSHIFGSNTPSSGFGAPAFGQSSSPALGQSSFGQPSTTSIFGKPAAGGFGQQSSLGQTSQSSGFGTTGFGQSAPRNPFAPASAATLGQPSQSPSAFGQTSRPTSGFGQPSFGQSSFGQPSQLSSGFGQPSQPGTGFGQPSKPTSPFGQQPQTTTDFGQPSQPAFALGTGSDPSSNVRQASRSTTPFGQSPQPALGFGQSAQSSSAFGSTVQSTSSFGQPSQPGSGFGQGLQPRTFNQAVPAFGQPPPTQATERKASNPFGSGAIASNPFGQPSQAGSSGPRDRPNPFAGPSSTASTTAATTTAPASNTSHPLTSKPAAPTHYTQTLPPGLSRTNPGNKHLILYKNCSVKYINDAPCYNRPDGKGWERIWFPDGIENIKLEDVQPGEEVYTEEAKQSYRYFAETGSFEVGKLPKLAPRREWVAFDF